MLLLLFGLVTAFVVFLFVAAKVGEARQWERLSSEAYGQPSDIESELRVTPHVAQRFASSPRNEAPAKVETPAIPLPQRDETVSESVERLYREKGLWPTDFRCPHRASCSAGIATFTEAKCSFVGPDYRLTLLPKVVFLSLDSGDGKADPGTRTLEGVRNIELRRDVSRLHKNQHWYHTLRMAADLLKPFDRKIDVENVLPHIAHVNTVKCSANLPNRRQAPAQMYRNCRRHIVDELRVLAPDILVTQGSDARRAVADLVPCSSSETLEEDGATGAIGMLEGLNPQKTMWLQTHHPSGYGAFHKQQRYFWPTYVATAENFIRRCR